MPTWNVPRDFIWIKTNQVKWILYIWNPKDNVKSTNVKPSYNKNIIFVKKKKGKQINSVVLVDFPTEISCNPT